MKMNTHDLMPSTHERTQQETDGTYGHLTRTDRRTKVTRTITKPRRSDGPNDSVATTDSPNDNAKREQDDGLNEYGERTRGQGEYDRRNATSRA